MVLLAAFLTPFKLCLHLQEPKHFWESRPRVLKRKETECIVKIRGADLIFKKYLFKSRILDLCSSYYWKYF